MIPEDCC